VLTLPNRLVNDVALPLHRWLGGDAYASPERLRAHVERARRRPVDPAPPRGVRRALAIDVTHRDGWPVYEARPIGANPDTTIVYIHGGGYVNEIVRWHWLLIAQLVREVPARGVVPIYPLAPVATVADVVPRMAELVGELVADGGAGPTIVIGDSAGGGIAVAASIAMGDRGLSQPSRLVLLSPFLDATMSDERQSVVARKDKMLRRPGLREAGRLYAGSLALDDPRVSPLHGDLRGLPPLTIFTGTHDILDCDSQRLAERARDAGLRVDLREVDGAPHAFPVLPTRQGAVARRQIVEICRRSGKEVLQAGTAARRS
jgi:epsilon-lactone hydrolase